MTTRLHLHLRISLAASLLLAGCAADPSAATPAMLATARVAVSQEARSARPRELSPTVSEDDLDTLALDNRTFAFDLYRSVRGEPGNLFYSPYSLSLALAMTFAGARGKTETEMASALRFSLPQSRLHAAFNATDLSLATANEGSEAFQLSIAKAVWGQQGFDLEPEFLDVLAVNYGAGLRLANFEDPAARTDINTWVSDATQGKVEELFPEGALDAGTRLVLANAIYFNADWETPFAAGATTPAPFHLLDGSTVDTPTMTRRATTGYATVAGFEALELYYKGGRASLIILLPATGQFAAFEAGLDAALVDDITQRLQPADLQIFMPKFAYAADMDLARTLAALGMPSAFDAATADFSGMDGRRDLYLTSVRHKAFVAVDEKGTEAAAATGVVAGITSMPQVVAVDRPFVFLIRDSETGIVLFVGRVVSPIDS